jgi:hypothetical protein
MTTDYLSELKQTKSPDDLCCFCGKPASQHFPFNTRLESTGFYPFGKSKMVTFSYGREISVPYCDTHYREALATEKKIHKYFSINSDAGLVLILACVILPFFLWKIETSHTDVFILFIILRVIGSLLFAGFLLFIFEPLFRTLTGILFPSFLSPAVGADLRAHINAHNEGWYNGGLPYSPGISVKYTVVLPEGIITNQIVFVTDPDYAKVSGRMCLPSSKK